VQRSTVASLPARCTAPRCCICIVQCTSTYFGICSQFGLVDLDGAPSQHRRLETSLPCEDTGLCNCVDQPNGITCAEKAAVLAQHNLLRSQVSPSATNMRRMKWDPKLEAVAQVHSARCVWHHNMNRGEEYRAEGGVSTPGENNALGGSNRFTVEAFTQVFYDEVADYTFSSNSCNPGAVCGHYTQLVWAASDLLGCGVTRCPNLVGGEQPPRQWGNRRFMVCNYFYHGNSPTVPYTSGPWCSDCPEGVVYDSAGRLCIERRA